MIATSQSRPEFLTRVSAVHTRSRRARWTALAAGTLFAWLCAVGILALCDFVWEWPWILRATAIGFATAVVSGGAILIWLRHRKRDSPTRTAADLETAFPALGQRARTTVQYGRQTVAQMRLEGVCPQLVGALIQETSTRSEDLPLDEAVPRTRIWVTGGLLIVASTALALGCVNWQWRTALSRTFLSDVPYTELSVLPGDVTVQTGAAVGISAKLVGRVDRDVLIHTREVTSDKQSAAWTAQSMLAESTADDGPRVASFGVGLEKIERSLAYRIEADGIVSPEYRIDVLDPLTVRRVDADVEYPEYTRLPTRKVSEGAISALRGSVCRFTVELSREPEDVQLSIQELPTKSHPIELLEEVSIQGPLITFVISVDRNILWTLAATTADGVSLDEQPFRIQVTEDRPPKLAFDDPDDGIEVHTLAELPMRARASDDYGLSRSGIVFQISGSEEFTLLEEHFDEVLEATQEAAASKFIVPRTRSVLERLLPLEHFELTQKDSVMYYAFAEDNHPSEPHRTESDRRFIDIRPLQQTFRRSEESDGDGGDGDGGRLRSLGELIRRERSILNWTIKLSRRVNGDNPRDVYSFDRLMRSQAEVADLTRLLAERLQQRGVDDVDAFYQAEAVMLEAIDSLAVGDLETAQLQEKDAQQYLVEGRNRLEIILSNRPTESLDYQALRNLDNLIMQRLRLNRPDREDAAQQEAQLIVSQLMRWARSEEEIAEQLAAVATDADMPEGAGSGVSNGDASQPTDPVRGAESTPNEDAESPGATSEEETSDEPVSVDFTAIEERQFQILADARELADVMADLQAVSDLAKERMTDATALLEQTAQAVKGRDTPAAIDGATQSARDLRELARQIVGLTQGDVADRIAFSRNLTTDLTRRQRQMAEELERKQEPGEETSESGMVGVSADELAERARTLEDVLLAIANSTNEDEGEAADLVTEVLDDRNLPGMRQRLVDVAERLGQGGGESDDETSPDLNRETPAVVAELRDTADSTERIATDLDQLYRQLLTPVMERLRDLEQQAAELAERIEETDNERQGGELAADLEELIEEMESVGAGGKSRDKLALLLQAPGRGELWVSEAGTGRMRLRAEYRQALGELLQELQLEIQELVLADTDLDVDSPIPAKYLPLVNRYLKVLSRRN